MVPPDPMIVYHAQHLLPVSSPPIQDGALMVDSGRISDLGTSEQVLENAQKRGVPFERRDLGPVAIAPGLVNAHTHIELSWAETTVEPAGDWVAWVRALIEARLEVDEVSARKAATRALSRIVRRGTVAVGDVANAAWAAPLIARAGLHGVAFLEMYGLNEDEAPEIAARATAICADLSNDPELIAARGRLAVTPSPHAPQTTSAQLLRSLGDRAVAADTPWTIHLAESAAESAWLRDGSGPLKKFYGERGFADPDWIAPGLSPVAYLRHLGVLGPRTVAVHCVQVNAEDRRALRESGAVVVTCPRSNELLGVGAAPVPDMLNDGITVAIGTDSLASSPDLDLLGEMAALRALHPEVPPTTILQMATWNGAVALGIEDRLGSLDVGKLAASIVVPVDGRDPVEAFCAIPPIVHLLGDAPFVEIQ